MAWTDWIEPILGAAGSIYGAKAASEAGEAPYTLEELKDIALWNAMLQSPNISGPFGSVSTTFQNGQPTTTTQIPEWMQGLLGRVAGRAANPDQYTPNQATYDMRNDRWARRGYGGAPTGPQSLPQAMIDTGMVQGNFNQPTGPMPQGPSGQGGRAGSEMPGAGSGGSVGVGGRGGGVGQGGGMGAGGEGRGEIGARNPFWGVGGGGSINDAIDREFGSAGGGFRQGSPLEGWLQENAGRVGGSIGGYAGGPIGRAIGTIAGNWVGNNGWGNTVWSNQAPGGSFDPALLEFYSNIDALAGDDEVPLAGKRSRYFDEDAK